MRVDRSDLLLRALRRRRPWWFALMVYLLSIGICSLVVDVGAATGWLELKNGQAFRYGFALSMSAPAIYSAISGWPPKSARQSARETPTSRA